jgi:predicted Zn-dependent protease
MFKQITAISLCAALLSLAGCASTTGTGAVGVTRQQLLTVSSEEVNAKAAQAYSTLMGEAFQAQKLNVDPVQTVRVRQIAQRLEAQVRGFRPDAVNWSWEVNVIDTDKINAFCAPGGKIGVYAGLIKQLDLSDDELAAVLGHEIAHALREHSREQASQNQLAAAISDGIAKSGTRNARTKSDIAAFVSVLFVQLPFSREMELEADVMGLELAARAGYDPNGATNLWRKMQAAAGRQTVDFFSTHPDNGKRVAELEAAIPKVPPSTERRPCEIGTRAPSQCPLVTPKRLLGQAIRRALRL